MSTRLTDLIHQLQDFRTQHLGGEARVRVAVTNPAHGSEQFEIGAVHQDGPVLVLSCQPLEEEESQPQDETPQHRAEPIRACLYNDYDDLC
jgi:hypothetical protein